MTKEEVKQYRQFMADSDNIMKCEGCPENRNQESPIGEDRKPCGQYHCWVWIATKD